MLSQNVGEGTGKGDPHQAHAYAEVVHAPRSEGRMTSRSNHHDVAQHVYGSHMSCVPAPRQEIPNEPIPPSLAKQIILDVCAPRLSLHYVFSLRSCAHDD